MLECSAESARFTPTPVAVSNNGGYYEWEISQLQHARDTSEIGENYANEQIEYFRELRRQKEEGW